MSRFPYQFFDEYVVRTPSFLRKNFQQAISNKDEITDVELKEICTNPIFQEAIYLASPNLYDELAKWINSEKQLLPKGHQKLKHTLLKYYSRISTRCTPFGLFASVGLGRFDEDLTDKQLVSLVRDTKLDMYFLVSLAQHFLSKAEVRNQLLFYPNNSVYKVGDNIRYIEYQYTGGKREYIISSAPISEELVQILDFSIVGKTIDQLADCLINEEVIKCEAKEYIEELVENQVLISEIEPNVSGNDFLDTLIFILNRIDAKAELENLILIKEKLGELDKNIGNPILLYFEIEELIKIFKTEYEQKYLFQTDLYNKDKFLLPSIWKKELKHGIRILNKINVLQRDTDLEKFKKAFNERFEDQEMSLAYVLDTEVGIGYKQDFSIEGVHSYLNDLHVSSSKKRQNQIIELNQASKILNEKIQNTLLQNLDIIELMPEDFKDFEENWDNLSDTLSVMAEIVSDKNVEKLFLKGCSRGSAASLLGRFCSEKADVQKLTKTITKKEQDLNPNCILAEIIHLPEARIGNVIRRPTLRDYEIPYLAQSILPKENQILVEDLLISLKNDRIILRSKRLNKEIKPDLTNAHNYYTNTLPVYHFLSDLHSQHVRSGLYFNWGGLENIYHFLPRVEYSNIILSKAQWKINEKDILFLDSSISDKDTFLSVMLEWRSKRKIPVWIEWVKFDHTLTICLDNFDMAKLFIQTVKNEKSIIVEEFLWNENDGFKREFIFPMFKET